MSDTKNLKLSFTGVAVHSENLAVVTTVRGDVPDDAVISHELVYIYENGNWEVYDAIDKNIVSVAFDETGEEITLLSHDGFILRLLPGQTIREEIDSSDDGPSDLVIMRRIRRWPSAEVVAGMARRVYAHIPGGGPWREIDHGCFVPRAQRTTAIGFNGIDGWSSNKLCAVGYKGEIWLRQNEQWFALGSPTNTTLMDVACSQDQNSFVAVGLGGTVVVGIGGTIRIQPQDEPLGHLWSVVSFNGAYYFAGDEGVFRLDGPALDNVSRLQLTSRGSPTSGYLSAGAGVIWSVGDRDLFESTDGVKWKRVRVP